MNINALACFVLCPITTPAMLLENNSAPIMVNNSATKDKRASQVSLNALKTIIYQYKFIIKNKLYDNIYIFLIGKTSLIDESD